MAMKYETYREQVIHEASHSALVTTILAGVVARDGALTSAAVLSPSDWVDYMEAQW